MNETRITSMVEQASLDFDAYRAGDSQRLGNLVDLLSPLLWHTARGQGVDQNVAEDVVQTAWVRLVENADQIADSRAVLGWLIVTVKRECWRLVKAANRTTAIPEDTDIVDIRDTAAPERVVELTQAQEILWRHVNDLPEKCRTLLRLVAFVHRPDYAAVAAALGMPVGSIGPTRGRCLAKLRQSLLSDQTWEGAR